jgi:hypothetical protein
VKRAPLWPAPIRPLAKAYLKALGEIPLQSGAVRIHAPRREHRFHPTRRWRFDHAWPAHKVALEVEGGIFTGGRHSRGAGMLKDMEKYNEAQLLGWRVFRVTPEQLRRGEATLLIARALGVRPKDTP